MNSDFDGCIITFEQAKKELEEIECSLAKRYGIKKEVRSTLIELTQRDELVEDKLVSQWHAAYSCYSEWVRAENQHACSCETSALERTDICLEER